MSLVHQVLRDIDQRNESADAIPAGLVAEKKASAMPNSAVWLALVIVAMAAALVWALMSVTADAPSVNIVTVEPDGLSVSSANMQSSASMRLAAADSDLEELKADNTNTTALQPERPRAMVERIGSAGGSSENVGSENVDSKHVGSEPDVIESKVANSGTAASEISEGDAATLGATKAGINNANASEATDAQPVAAVATVTTPATGPQIVENDNRISSEEEPSVDGTPSAKVAVTFEPAVVSEPAVVAAPVVRLASTTEQASDATDVNALSAENNSETERVTAGPITRRQLPGQQAFQQALAAMQQQQWSQAQQLLAPLLEISAPQPAKQRYRTAYLRTLIEQQLWPQATAFYRAHQQRRDLQWLAVAAPGLHMAGEYALAAPAYQQLMQLQPDQASWPLALLWLYRQMDNTQAARALLPTLARYSGLSAQQRLWLQQQARELTL
ncbi:hypothetical protein CHH28_00105 [Bacterioplanes sanyensis]|uniref:Uncharacterized protein n=1 Tax=Bacterioplanes sanyensis TaxID=1249553 RepID=A0A222FFJ6_9GAMM|nr:hypothetical protein [Bacterioplanes sanyensis]ASP37181.1 hypothetical protein CHH28_00105 [Bacterioplanes sanyensis]